MYSTARVGFRLTAASERIFDPMETSERLHSLLAGVMTLPMIVVRSRSVTGDSAARLSTVSLGLSMWQVF